MKLIIRHNPLVTDEDIVITTNDVLGSLYANFSKWPNTAKLYQTEVSDENEIPLETESDLKSLSNLDGTVYCVVYPAILAAVATIGAIGAIASIGQNRGKSQSESYLTVERDSESSANNIETVSLTDRSNSARLNQRVPDIYGSVISIPDALNDPYKDYNADGGETEYAYYCVGRGDYEITELKDGDALIAGNPNTRVEVYGPNTSPNLGTPKLSINGGIDEQLLNIITIGDFENQKLEPFVDVVGTITGSTKIRISVSSDNQLPVSSAVTNGSVSAVNTPSSTIIWGMPTDYDYGNNAAYEAFTYHPDQWAGAAFSGRYTLDGTNYYRTPLDFIDRGDYTPPLLSIGAVNDGLAAPTSASGTGYILLSEESVFTRFATDPPLTGNSDRMIIIQDSSIGWMYTDGTNWYGFTSLVASDVILAEIDFTNHTISAPQSGPSYRSFSDTTGTGTGSFGIQVEIKNLSTNDVTNLDGLFDVPSTLRRFTTTIDNPYPGDDVELTIARNSNYRKEQITEDLTTQYWINQGFDEESAQLYLNLRQQSGRGTITRTGDPIEDSLQVDNIAKVEEFDFDHFGDVTTIFTKTTVNSNSTVQTNRVLSCRAKRIIPLLNTAGTAFDTVGTSSKFTDILIAISTDSLIGNRTLDEIDVVNFRVIQAEIESYFDDSQVGEFNYTFDNSNTTFEESLALIGEACFTNVYRFGSQIKLFFEKRTDNSSLLFNHRNKVPGTESRTVVFGNEFDGVELEYTDNEGSQDFVFLPEDRSAVNPLTLKILGVTNRLQAYFHAHRLRNKQLYQNTFLEFEALQESDLLTINERVDVSDNTTATTFDGQIMSKEGTTVSLSPPFEFVDGESYTIFLQDVAGEVKSVGITAGSNSKEVILDSDTDLDLSVDSANYAVATYEIVENSSTRVRSFIVQEKRPNTFTSVLELANYDDRFYDNDSDLINNVINSEGN